MSIIHQATLTPSKRDLIEAWLDQQPWGGTGDIDLLGSYRFDDPAGEVGVEAMVLRRGDLLLHMPLTYRSAPLPNSEPHLIGTAEHSALGTRWVYAAAADPVAMECFTRALQGEQDQADMELWDGDTLLERRASKVRVHPETDQRHTFEARTTEAQTPQLRLLHLLDATPDADVRLVAEWDGGRATVATLSGVNPDPRP
jgi:hypothetical protein